MAKNKGNKKLYRWFDTENKLKLEKMKLTRYRTLYLGFKIQILKNRLENMWVSSSDAIYICLSVYFSIYKLKRKWLKAKLRVSVIGKIWLQRY